ncbi:P-loop containing nucleoside triphosphate hydrolase protein [Glonium stellatum]|uniref:P-loop containing nucleoside triphosphate hydrolase protein n=1 Tax=Glonium stellatum TaxID=574774 RepID=A0A8E2JXQ2_9PEZI|nr:P-loop containing nucleoside triphosphate hydrolase protein [Glonium stellatum]
MSARPSSPRRSLPSNPNQHVRSTSPHLDDPVTRYSTEHIQICGEPQLGSPPKAPSVKPTSIFSIYKRLFGFATPREKVLCFIGIICSIGSGAIFPLMTLIFGSFVTIFTQFAIGETNSAAFMANINHYTLYFIYLFIASAGLTYISMVCFTIFSTNVTSSLRKSYVHVILNQRLVFHETELTPGAVSMALSSHSNAIRSGLAEKFGLSLKSCSTVAAAFIVALSSQWKLALVTSTIIPAVVVVVGITSALDEKLEQSINVAKSDAATVAEEIVSSVRTMRALRATEKLCKKYESYLMQATNIGWKRSPISGIQTGSYMFILYCGYALAFWYGVRLFANHEAKTSGKVITTLFSIMIGVNAFAQLAAYLGSFMKVRSAGANLFQIIDSAHTDTPVSDSGLDGALPSGPFDHEKGVSIFRQDITFTNVKFQYPTRSTYPALDRFSLTIPAGKTTALVGASGSGKSTVVSLLLKWYDVTEGHLFYGGMDASKVPSKSLRANIGFVQQEPYLFSGTVSQNIEYGLAGSPLSDLPATKIREIVIQACKLANAHEFIMEMPNDYDTPVGNRGSLLSGGQKQRLAIARAIIKNPPILILDEATSALDVNSESVVQKALEQASRDRTTIVIAHRLSTIKSSDKIVVMQKGRVVEEGSHVFLAAKTDGIYRQFWEAQALESGASSSQQEHDPKRELHEHQRALKMEAKTSPETNIKSEGFNQGLFRVLARLLLTQKKFWLAFSVIVLASIVGALGALFPTQAILYAKVVTAFRLSGAALISQGNFWGLMWFILSIIVGVAYCAIGGIGAGLGEAISQSYRISYFKSMLQQPILFFDSLDNSPSNLISRLATDPDAVNSLAGNNVAVLVTVGVSLISTSALALVVGWKLALVVLVGGLPLIFGAGLVHERMENSFEEVAGKMFSDSVGFAGECAQAIRTVSALNLEHLVENQFGQLLTEHCHRARRYAVRAMIWFALSEAIDLLCMALAFWYGGRLLSTREYDTTQFFTVFIAIVFGAQSMGQFLAHSSDISKGVSSANSIFSMEDRIPNNSLQRRILPPLGQLEAGTPLIEFKKASFTYPTRPSRQVLSDFDLKVHQGQYIALVGASGSGKSTVVGLLERFYDLNVGELLISGISVTELDDEDIRKQFSLVSQEPVLYQGTIRENILLGTTSSLSGLELENITKRAQIYEFLSSLPEGLETQVGHHGTALSGGQKQRIAIARAIAQDSPILLLDEATSALDSESERMFQGALREGYTSKTVIAIAHRLSTIQHADLILVMQNGTVAEQGTHAELLALRGIYYHMI